MTLIRFGVIAAHALAGGERRDISTAHMRRARHALADVQSVRPAQYVADGLPDHAEGTAALTERTGKQSSFWRAVTRHTQTD